MDLVSIVIPIYNMSNSIEKTVESLLCQTYKNIEILLIDDGSKDESYKMCLDLQKKDKRIKAFHQENKGSGPARNLGIEKATGKFIYFPDADDYIEKDTIQRLINYENKNNVDLIVFGYKNIDVNGKLLFEKKYNNEMFDGEFIRNDYSEYYSSNGKYTIQGAPWNKFFVLDVIKRNNIEYPSLRRHQDEAFIAKYVAYIKSVLFVDDVLYTYYVNDLSRQWDKYPITYFENIGLLFDERKKNLLVWNKNDLKTHNLVYLEYIYGIIKSLELSFSKKYQFNFKSRVKWLREKRNSILFDEIPKKIKIRFYQRIIWFLLKHNMIFLSYIIMSLKIKIEKRLSHV